MASVAMVGLTVNGVVAALSDFLGLLLLRQAGEVCLCSLPLLFLLDAKLLFSHCQVDLLVLPGPMLVQVAARALVVLADAALDQRLVLGTDLSTLMLRGITLEVTGHWLRLATLPGSLAHAVVCCR